MTAILNLGSITSPDDANRMTQGDTHTPYSVQVWTAQQVNNQWVLAPMNLTGLTPSMVMISAKGAMKVCSGPWVVDNPGQGMMHYHWQSTDVDTPGIWTRYVKLTDTNSEYVHALPKDLDIQSAPSAP